MSNENNNDLFKNLQSDINRTNERFEKMAIDWNRIGDNIKQKATDVFDFAKDKVENIKNTTEKITNENAHKLSVVMAKNALKNFVSSKNDKSIYAPANSQKILNGLEQCHWGLKKNIEDGIITDIKDRNYTMFLINQLESSIDECKSIIEN